jgi:endonuclease/exonuclease/phosphatase family metal-dependent hydrolase
LTLNIWHNAGPWAERRRRIREWIDALDPDLIGFQEILRGRDLDQLAELVADRGYHVDSAKAVDFWLDPTLAFGNGVATRWPISDREELRLPDGGDAEQRVALAVTVDAPIGPICLATTHLNWKFHHGAIREQQAVAVCDLALRRRPKDGFPPILVGDFNAEPESSEVRYITGLQSIGGRSVYFRDAWRHAGTGSDGLTWSNRNDFALPWLEPDRRIDYIFVGPPRPDCVGMIETCRVVCDDKKDGVWPSDHFGLYAELRVEPRS